MVGALLPSKALLYAQLPIARWVAPLTRMLTRAQDDHRAVSALIRRLAAQNVHSTKTTITSIDRPVARLDTTLATLMQLPSMMRNDVSVQPLLRVQPFARANNPHCRPQSRHTKRENVIFVRRTVRRPSLAKGPPSSLPSTP